MADRRVGGEDSEERGRWNRKKTNIFTTIQDGLKEMWATGSLSDITIKADGREFKAHRTVLAVTSPFFMAMLTGEWIEAGENKPIEMKGVTAVGLQHVLNFIYTGALKLEPSYAFEVLMAADHLQVMSAVDICVDSLMMEENMTIDNCVDVLNYAKMHDDYNLDYPALDCITDNFWQVLLNKDHLNLGFESLQFLLGRDLDGEDGMEFGPEVSLFYAVVEWLSHNKEQRMKHLEQLIGFIRFPLMSITDLEGILKTVPFMTENVTCQKLITDAQSYQQKPAHLRVIDVSKSTTVRSKESVFVTSPVQSGNIEAFTLSPHHLFYLLPETTNWTQLKDFPVPNIELNSCRGEVYPVVVNGFLIVLVVQESSCHAQSGSLGATVSAHLFDPRKSEWSELASYEMKNRHTIKTAVGCGEELFVFMNQEDEAAEILIYNFNSNTWKQDVYRIPTFTKYSVCAYKEELYLFELKRDNTKCFKYDPKTDIWTENASSRVDITCDKSEAYVSDGHILHVSISNKLHLSTYIPEGDLWTYKRCEERSLKRWPVKSVRLMCGDNLFSLNSSVKPYTSEYCVGSKFTDLDVNMVIKHSRLPLELKRGCLAVSLKLPKHRGDAQ